MGGIGGTCLRSVACSGGAGAAFLFWSSEGGDGAREKR